MNKFALKIIITALFIPTLVLAQNDHSFSLKFVHSFGELSLSSVTLVEGEANDQVQPPESIGFIAYEAVSRGFDGREINSSEFFLVTESPIDDHLGDEEIDSMANTYIPYTGVEKDIAVLDESGAEILLIDVSDYMTAEAAATGFVLPSFNFNLKFSQMISWTLVGVGGAFIVLAILMFTGGKKSSPQVATPVGAGNLQKTPVGYVNRPVGAGAPPGFVRTSSGGLKAVSPGVGASQPPVQQTRKITEPVQQIPKQVEINPALIDYINKARAAGQKDFAIQSALLAAGWDSKVVGEHLKNN